MAPALIAMSAVSSGLLACFLPVKRVYSDVPSLALVFWLLVANLIHLVNAIVWAGNVEVHSEIWCDITTKLVLGVNVAIPAAFLCIGRQLELLSSKRKLFNADPRYHRNSMIFEALCCYFIPLIYMSLHIISQDSRYDLVVDMGCTASIHPSTPALITIWVLPLVLCVIALFFCGFALHHSLHMNSSAFSLHLSSRTTMGSGVLFRRLTTAMIVTGVLVVTTLFSLFSIPSLKAWTNWQEVHQRLGDVTIITLPQEIAAIRVGWWTLFVISIVYVLLLLVIGEETRDSYRWFVAQSVKCQQGLSKLHSKVKSKLQSKSFSIRRPRRELVLPMAQKKPTRPYTVELRSGWDDMLEFKVPSSPSPKGTKSASSSPTPSSQQQFPVSAKVSQMSAEDTAFMNSTISYLGSPPAQSLGVSSPTLERPPAFHLPRKPLPALSVTIDDPVLPWADSPVLGSPARLAARTPSVKSAKPQIASVFEAEWPIPPSTPSPVCSRYATRSPTHSIADSTYSDVPSYYREGRPFEGASIIIPASSHSGHSPEAIDHSGRGPALKRSLQSLRISWDRVRHGSSPSVSGPDGIRMTVVRETA
ncbi:pheromone receptor [Coprinopsis sp. MPI-PUGE-AT-0042]|nr:pheromone receptor [Coprinopsis sp. MPI-PUGE-AT-0042]